LRIERWPPTFLRAALDALIKLPQVHTPDQRPDRPRQMILVDESLHVHRAPAHLLSVDPSDQRLVVRVFLAHAASLRHGSFFARLKFKRFLHSFVCESEGLLTLLFPFVGSQPQPPRIF